MSPQDETFRQERRDLLNLDRVLMQFAGRVPMLDRLRDALVTVTLPRVLALHGIGGSGKTFLLAILRVDDELCRLLSACPNAWLNFRAGQTPTDTASALWEVRQQLVRTGGLAFIRFDLLWAHHFQMTHHLPVDKRPGLIPEDAKTLTELVSVIEHAPVLGAAVKAINFTAEIIERGRLRLAQREVRDWLDRYIGGERLMPWREALPSLSIGELEELLPAALAADIAASAQLRADDRSAWVGDRAVIVIDTYERLKRPDVAEPPVTTFVSQLADELLQAGARATLIIAGRDPLRWGERMLDDTWTPSRSSPWCDGVQLANGVEFVSRHLEQRLVDNFTLPETLEYLVQRRGLEEPTAKLLWQLTHGYVLGLALAADLLTGALEDSELGAEVQWLLGQAQPSPSRQGWPQGLAARLLNRILEQLARQGRVELRALLRAAAVLRWFDADLLFAISEALNQDIFAELLAYSFVEQMGPGRYRLHAVARAMLFSTTRTAELQHWRQRAVTALQDRYDRFPGDATFPLGVEIAYQRAHLDERSGTLALHDLFEEALGDFRIADCKVVVDTLNDDLVEQLRETRLLRHLMAARLARVTIRYEEAVEEMIAAEAAIDTLATPLAVRVTREAAEVYRLMGRHQDAHTRLDSLVRLPAYGRSQPVQALVAWERSLIYKDTDRLPEALAESDRARRLLFTLDKLQLRELRELGIRDLELKRLHLLRQRARLRYLLGDYRGTAEDLEAFLPKVGGPQTLGSAYAQVLLGHVARQEGDLRAALELAEQSIEFFDTAQERRGVNSACILLANTHLGLGLLEVYPILRRQLTKDPSIGLEMSGDLPQANDHLTRARTLYQELIADGAEINPYGPLYGHLGLGQLCWLEGNTQGARRHFENVVRGTSQIGSRVEAAYARLGLARLELQRGSTHAAVRYLRIAWRTGRRCAMPWLRLHSALLLAVAQPTQAERWIAEATSAAASIRTRPSARMTPLQNMSEHLAQDARSHVFLNPAGVQFP